MWIWILSDFRPKILTFHLNSEDWVGFTVYVAAYSFDQDFYFFKLTEEKLSPVKTKLYETCLCALILIASWKKPQPCL